MEDNMKVSQRGKKTTKITVHYDDGSSKDITKGVVITDHVVEEDHTLTFEFVDVTGTEVADIIYGVTEMGVQAGLFDGGEEEAQEERILM